MLRITDCISEGPYKELRVLSAFDHYFSFSGREYRALNPLLLNNQPAFEVERVESDQQWLLTALKVISLFTLIVPLIMVIGKLICRSQYAFYLKGSHLKEPDPVEIPGAKVETPAHVPENIKNFEINDQATLFEIAKLCAEKIPSPVPSYIENFGIKDQAALEEIAKLCVEIKPSTADKKDEDDEIADPGVLQEEDPEIETKAKVQSISDEEIKMDQPKKPIQNDDECTTQTILSLGIQSQSPLTDIAKLCAKKAPCSIKSFGISDPSVLQGSSSLTETEAIDEIPQEEQAKIDRAKELFKNYDQYMIGKIVALGIKDLAALLIDMAKIYTENQLLFLAEDIQKFGIKDPSELVKIAKIWAEKAPWAIARFIKNFGITDQAILVSIAKLCAEKDPMSVAENIPHFGITDQGELAKIATMCAEKDPLTVAFDIQNFGITDQKELVTIAKVCAEKLPWAVAENIQNFGITDQAELIKIAKICAKNYPQTVIKNTKKFGLTDLSVLGLNNAP